MLTLLFCEMKTHSLKLPLEKSLKWEIRDANKVERSVYSSMGSK